jgi:hypothetical protein
MRESAPVNSLDGPQLYVLSNLSQCCFFEIAVDEKSPKKKQPRPQHQDLIA